MKNMKKYSAVLLAAFLMVGMPEQTLAQTSDVYVWVSPQGDDAGEGSEEQPFATLEQALSHVRQMRGQVSNRDIGKVHIVMKGGTYQMNRTLRLTAADSGTPSSPTLVEAAAGETPIISGGVEVQGWQDAGTVAGLPAVAQGRVWEAPLPEVDGQPARFRQFWVNGQKMRRSSTLDDLSLPRLISVNKEQGVLTVPRIEQEFSHPEKLEMTIIQDWTTNTLRVKTLTNDDKRSRLTFLNPESEIEFKRPWPILRADEGSYSNHMFYLSNAIELLDHPQEWFGDAASGKLYYWPRSGETHASVQAVAPVLETLIQIEGSKAEKVSNLVFSGITFEHTTWLRPAEMGHVGLQAGQYLFDAYSDESAPGGNVAWVGRPKSAVSVTDARNVSFENCQFRHIGATALDFVSGTKQMTVRGCSFSDIGGTAVQAGYFGDETFESHMVYNPADYSEVCDSITIDNNYIAHVAREDWGCIGIGIGYASNITISHNELFDTPYSAISLGWGWTKSISCMKNNRIFANYIHNFSNQMRDSGAIYTLSAQPNSSIENNFIEDVGDPLLNPVMWDMRHSQFDLYLDEGSDYFIVRNNWCERGEYSRNQNGDHNTWGTNGNGVAAAIKDAAGLEDDYQSIKQWVKAPDYAPADSLDYDNSAKELIEYVAQNEGFKMGTAIAVDLNDDNRLDIVYGGGESFQVQHGGVRINTGNYSFAATQGIKRLNMNNLAAGDLNGDGHIDLIQAGWDFYNNYNAMLLNDGKGRLTQHQLPTGKNTSPACGIADVNNDGLTDYFFVGNGKDNSFYLQRYNHTFGDAVSRLELPDGMSNPSITYADFNNDQSVDICVLSSKNGGVFTRMYYNDGEGKFAETSVGFTEYGTRGAMAYADVNNDGYLDIAIGGQFAGEQWNATAAEGAKIVTVYLNDKNGGFIRKQQFSEYMFDNVTQPVRFCDWDNDGNADLIVTGWNMTQGNISRTDVFLNNGQGVFTKIQAGLPCVSEGAIELADFGNSGRNDILISGNCNSGYNGFSGDRRIAVLCRNLGDKANTPPTAPTGLVAEVGEKGSVTLEWGEGADAETPTKALSYNYYLRDLSTGLYMTFPNADVQTGKRRVSAMGNVWLNRSWTLQNLPAGTYAWSVQTIDAGYAGSAFAPEQTFTVVDGAEVLIPISYPEKVPSATAEYNAARLQLYQYLVEVEQMKGRGISGMTAVYQRGAEVYNLSSVTTEQLVAAVDEVRAAIVATTQNYEQDIPATYGIVNPGFENITSQHDSSNGAPFGWTLKRNKSTVTNTNTWYWFGANTDGTDKEGDYVWGIWNGGSYGNIELTQQLTGLPNGIWRLTARLMNNNTESGNLARVVAGSSSILAGGVQDYTSLPTGEYVSYGNGWATSDFDMSNVVSVYAPVTDGTLLIGVHTNGFFKVDDFQLTFLAADTATCPITIGEDGYAAIVTPAPLELAHLPNGLRAYKITRVDTSKNPVLAEVEKAVGGGVPLLFVGTPDETYEVPIAVGRFSANLSLNKLRATNRTVTTTGNGSTRYVLDTRVSNGTGFYLVNNGEAIPQGSAYLEVSTSKQPFLALPAWDTSIESLSADVQPTYIYNVAGQRLKQLQKGINIVNGKKYLVE